MSEQIEQRKIIKFLEAEGHYVIKVIEASRSGIPDIVGCTTKGTFFCIEVKLPGGRLSALQKVNLTKAKANNAIAFVAYGFQDFKIQWNTLSYYH